MKKVNLLIIVVVLALFFSTPAQAQELHGGFLTELSLTSPFPPSISLKSLIYLSASFRGVSFTSETVFNLASLDTQTFNLSFTIGILAVEEELVFKGPTFSFHRNDLLGSVSLAGLDLGVNVLLEDLPPPPGGLNPGLVVKIGGKTALGIGVYSFTGFGASEVAEDLVDIGGTDLGNTETWSFNCRRPLFDLDAEPDRQVIPIFVFTEEVVRLSLAIDDFEFLSDTKFSGTGFDQEVLTVGYSFAKPEVLFTSTSVFDNTFSFAEQIFRLKAAVVKTVHFFSVTRLSGPPLSFTEQEFKIELAIEGFRFILSTLFDMGGFSQFSLYLGVEI